MTSTNARSALEAAVDALPRGLRDHVLRVVDESRRLAARFGADEERAVIAALGHDLARASSPAELLAQAEALGVEASVIERAEPVLLHGPVSARIMSERYGVDDEEALAAARYHTTGRAGMGLLERVIFVADKIEPGKSGEDAELAKARELADESLESAMRCLLDRQVRRALQRGWPLHPHTVAARNELMAGRG